MVFLGLRLNLCLETKGLENFGFELGDLGRHKEGSGEGCQAGGGEERAQQHDVSCACICMVECTVRSTLMHSVG